MKVRAIVSGSLALVILELVVTSKQTARVGTIMAFPAAAAQWLIDPSIAAIPNIAGAPAGGVGATTPPGGASTPTTTPAVAATPPRLPGTTQTGPSSSWGIIA